MRLSKLRSCSGQSMIEFAVILPILMVLMFSIFEWSQIFIMNMRASTMSREIALAVHRQCKSISPDAAAPQETIAECMNRLNTELAGQVAGVFPRFEERGGIFLSLYGTNGVSATASTGNDESYYSLANIDPEVMAAVEIVAVGEFFYENLSISPLERLFSFVMPKRIYKATII